MRGKLYYNIDGDKLLKEVLEEFIRRISNDLMLLDLVTLKWYELN